MEIAPFRLERYFARHEFRAPYLLSCSDCEPLAMEELVARADDECRQLWRELRLAYTDSSGDPRLRRQVAAGYREVSEEDVLVVAPEEGIFLAMHALLATGDHVVCTFPGYQSLYQLAFSLGCEVSFWRPRETDSWRFDPEDLAPLLREDTRLVVVNLPHNPTGALPTGEEQARILELATAVGARLFSDEMYRLLEHDPADRLPAACDLDPKAVSLAGLSKSFGLPGLRIGWLATRDRELLDACRTLRDYTTICSAAPAEVLALMGLRGQEWIVARHRERVLANLRVLEGLAAKRSDRLRLRRPRAGSICFPRLVVEGGVGAFCERLVEEEGLMLLPSGVLDHGDAHVRLGLGREDFPENLERLARCL